jgi:phage terminase small subunit
MALNPKQERFCNEYLVDYNATQAAIRAGYSKKTAYVIAAEILSKKEVQEYLSAKKTILADQLSITQQRTMQEIGRIAYHDIRKLFNKDGSLVPIHELDDDSAAVLAGFDVEEIYAQGEQIGVTKKLKKYDKTKALEMLAKHYKIYSDAPIQNNTIKFGYGPEQPV